MNSTALQTSESGFSIKESWEPDEAGGDGVDEVGWGPGNGMLVQEAITASVLAKMAVGASVGHPRAQPRTSKKSLGCGMADSI